MAHENKGHYAKKHPADRKVNPEVANALKKRISAGGISCAAAHNVANDLGIPPAEIGFTLDSLELRIVECQLGLFGYQPEKKMVKPAEIVSPELEKAIKDQLSNNRLSCKAAWELGVRRNIKKMEVASACEALRIKISSCQLGAF